MKKATKKYMFIAGAILVILLAAIGVYMLFIRDTEKPMLSVYKYYDKDGIEIPLKQQSVVGGVEGVYYIEFMVNVKNEDTIPLNFEITSSSPPSFTTTLASAEIKSIESEASDFWITEKLEIPPFEDEGTADLSVCVTGSSDIRQSSTICGDLTLDVLPDPYATFTVTIGQV